MRELKITKSITNRNEESLFRYLNEIGQVRMIDSNEEVALAAKIRMGDRAAEHKLVTANLRFVVSCAKKYRNLGLSLNDLVSEGNLGLIKAAKLFDETKGFKFISYAVWWVRQSIITAINTHARMIRVPMNQKLGVAEINKEAQKLEQLLEREPSLEEVAEVMGKHEADLAHHISANLPVQYLDDPIPGGESDSNSLMNFVPCTNENQTVKWVETEAESRLTSMILSRLAGRDKQIVEMWFGLVEGEPLNDETIGLKIGLSSERVRQLRAKAITKLRSDPAVARLKAFA